MHLFVIFLCVFTLAESAPQKENDCGIVGGDPADIREFPYQLSLRAHSNQHKCGGSIISDTWAVSAAHCHEPNVRYTLVAGASLLNQGGSVHPVVKFILHPSYNSQVRFNNDIAVLQVQTPFPLGSSGVNRIALATQPPPVGAQAIVSGWGTTQEGGRPPNQLQKVLVPIVSDANCRKAYPQKISEQMVCAGRDAGGQNACHGDSGGPLVVNNQLVGVVSWSDGCARPGRPAVYARVDRLYNWVKQVSGV